MPRCLTLAAGSAQLINAACMTMNMAVCAQLIYSGPLGAESSALIGYLEAVPGVHPVRAGENPATWMLEVTGGASITGKSVAAAVDFAEYYKVIHALPAVISASRFD